MQKRAYHAKERVTLEQPTGTIRLMETGCLRQEPSIIRPNSPRKHIGENWRILMASTKRRYSKEEFARRGDAIYENDVRPHLKPKDDGKFVAIDIETGVYKIDEDELEAGETLRGRFPNAQIWIVRVGSRSVHRFGGRELRQTL